MPPRGGPSHYGLRPPIPRLDAGRHHAVAHPLADAVWAMMQLAAVQARRFVVSLYSTASTAGPGFTSS